MLIAVISDPDISLSVQGGMFPPGYEEHSLIGFILKIFSFRSRFIFLTGWEKLQALSLRSTWPSAASLLGVKREWATPLQGWDPGTRQWPRISHLVCARKTLPSWEQSQHSLSGPPQLQPPCPAPTEGYICAQKQPVIPRKQKEGELTTLHYCSQMYACELRES